MGWDVVVGDGNHGAGADSSLPIHPPGMVEVIPKRCVPIAKKELLYMGTVGWACWLSGMIFIDRQRTGDAIDVISQTAKTIQRENVSRRNWVGGRQGLGRTTGVTVGRWCLGSMLASHPVLCSSKCGFSQKAPGTRADPCCPSSAGRSTWLCRLR